MSYRLSRFLFPHLLWVDECSPPPRRNSADCGRPAPSGRAAVLAASFLRERARSDRPAPPAAARTGFGSRTLLARCAGKARPPLGPLPAIRCLPCHGVRATHRSHPLLCVAASDRAQNNFRSRASNLLPALGISPSTRYSHCTGVPSRKTRSRVLPSTHHFCSSRSRQPRADRRDRAQRQTEAQRCASQHRGLVRQCGKATTCDSSCSANARRRHYPHRAPTEFRRGSAARCCSSRKSQELAHVAALHCRSSAGRARFERGHGLSISAACCHRASTKRRKRIHSTGRSEYRTEFHHCSRAPTSGRRPTRCSRISIRRPQRSATRSSAAISLRFGILFGFFWSARPRHCLEPASRGGCAAQPARQPSRRILRHARRPCWSVGLTRFKPRKHQCRGGFRWRQRYGK